MRGVAKMFKKSEVWSSHGKHAKIDPYFLNPPRLDYPTTEWFSDIRELFRRSRHRK